MEQLCLRLQKCYTLVPVEDQLDFLNTHLY